MPPSETVEITGRCECGRVRYRGSSSADITECHCSQCRRQSGHRYATARAGKDDIRVDGEEHMTWYRSSDIAERGFCKHCGSTLFWRSFEGDEMAVLAGTIDDTGAMRLSRHIFVDDKASYYEIDDDMPQRA